VVCKNWRVLRVFLEYNDGCYATDSRRYPKWPELGFVFRVFLQCYKVGLAEKGLKLFRDLSVDDMVEKAC
jgi:hypothetical protein